MILKITHLLKEAINLTLDSFKRYKSRNLLACLGISIGIFVIISILGLIKSLEIKILNGFAFLGKDVSYIQKLPLSNEYSISLKDYYNNKEPTFEEYQFLKSYVLSDEYLSFYSYYSSIAIDYNDNSIPDAGAILISENYDKIVSIDIQEGRYFNRIELKKGLRSVIIGSELKENLFVTRDPLNRHVKINNVIFRVIGVLEKKGKGINSISSLDRNCLIPYNSFTSVKANKLQTSIAIRAIENKNNFLLEARMRKLLRIYRNLYPEERDNFAINNSEFIKSAIDIIIRTLKTIGFVISSFSFLIGIFGVFNVIFISVKQQSSTIGLFKALGSKDSFILLLFLLQSTIVCYIGSIIGVILTLLLSLITINEISIQLDATIIMIFLAFTFLLGIISGVMPAIKAARMNPSKAIANQV